MTRRKAFWLRIEIDIHSVHSDGSNHCHAGKVALQVHTLSSIAVTMPARPLFPIYFREKLIFEKVIDCVSTLAEIQDHLNKEPLIMELVQWPRSYLVKPKIISHFRTKLSSLLFPAHATKGLSHGGDTRIVMEPGENFGGTSGANVEVSTKLIIAETTNHGTIRIPEVGNICSENQIQQNKSYKCCRHSIKSQLPNPECPSKDHCRRKPRSKQKYRDGACIQIHGTTSCNNCCICKCYSGYFDGKPCLGNRSRSCSCVKSCNDFPKPRARDNSGPTISSSLSSLGSYTRNSKHISKYSMKKKTSSSNIPRSQLTSDGVENPVSHRQLFYDNLDLFYRELRGNKYESK